MECREHLDNCLDRWVKERLRENRPGLLEDISVSGTLYDRVYSKKILNKETLETIKSSGNEIDQKRKLLDELEKRGWDAYWNFHDALYEDEQGHVVEKYLPFDMILEYLIIQRIQEELARVYDIPRAVGRFSTNPISNTDAIFNDNDLDLFQKRIDSNGNGISPRRIVIRQSVGTDENSSIPKELAADWARSVLNSSKGRAILQKFKLVLKLNLREVHSGDTLKLIIQSQLLPGPPEETGIYPDMILEYMKYCPQDVAILLDGCDEYSNECKAISDLIEKRSFKDVCVVMSTRQTFLGSYVNQTLV